MADSDFKILITGDAASFTQAAGQASDSSKRLKIDTADLSDETKKLLGIQGPSHESLKAEHATKEKLGEATRALGQHTHDAAQATREHAEHAKLFAGEGGEMRRIVSEINRTLPGTGALLRDAFNPSILGGVGVIVAGVAMAKEALDEYDKKLDEVAEKAGAPLGTGVEELRQSWNKAKTAMEAYNTQLLNAGRDLDPLTTAIKNEQEIAKIRTDGLLSAIRLTGQLAEISLRNKMTLEGQSPAAIDAAVAGLQARNAQAAGAVKPHETIADMDAEHARRQAAQGELRAKAIEEDKRARELAEKAENEKKFGERALAATTAGSEGSKAGGTPGMLTIGDVSALEEQKNKHDEIYEYRGILAGIKTYFGNILTIGGDAISAGSRKLGLSTDPEANQENLNVAVKRLEQERAAAQRALGSDSGQQASDAAAAAKAAKDALLTNTKAENEYPRKREQALAVESAQGEQASIDFISKQEESAMKRMISDQSLLGQTSNPAVQREFSEASADASSARNAATQLITKLRSEHNAQGDFMAQQLTLLIDEINIINKKLRNLPTVHN